MYSIRYSYIQLCIQLGMYKLLYKVCKGAQGSEVEG